MNRQKQVVWVALGLLLFFGGWLALAAAGAFDPRPIGVLVATRPLPTRTIATADMPVQWLPEPQPPDNYSLRLTAAFVEGDLEGEYGLAIGEPEDYLSVVVSPLGYTAVRRHQSTKNLKLFPFQPWPHVHHDNAENEIWLDVVGEEVTVRVNRELLWQGNVGALGDRIGLVGRTRRETAVVAYHTLTIFAEK